MGTKIRSLAHVTILTLVFALIFGLALAWSDPKTLAAQEPEPKQEGIAYVSWWFDQYESSGSDESLAKLENTGAEWISVLATWYQDVVTSTEIYSHAEKTPTDAGVIQAIETAHALGLKVMLKPHLDLFADSAHWRGQIGEQFTEEAEWDAWFESYQAFINHYAQIAADYDVEQFCIGTELDSTAVEELRWREMITGTGGITGVYTGPLVYAANHTYTNTVMFWDALDYIGIDAYYSLATTTTATLEDFKLGWTAPISFLENLAEEWDKPIIFTEIGYRSIDGAGMAPWAYEGSPALDLQEQADLYQAFFETVYQEPWFAGVFLWSWDINPMQGGGCDRGYTPLDKPAEDVLRHFFGGAPKSGVVGLTPRPNELGAMYIYTDQLASGWWNGSWGTVVDLESTAPVFQGQHAISATASGWGGLSLGDGVINSAPYQWFEFYMHKANPDHNIMTFWYTDQGQELNKIDDCRYRVSESDGWALVRIPLKALGADNKALQKFAMQPYVDGGSSTFSIDDVRLLGVIPVELSDGYAQSAKAGETVTYTHILQNFYHETASFALSADSSRHWPLELRVGDPGLTYTGPFPLGAGMTTTVQIILTIPLTETAGVTDTTTLVAYGVDTIVMYSDYLEDITTVIPTIRYIYLPLVMRNY